MNWCCNGLIWTISMGFGHSLAAYCHEYKGILVGTRVVELGKVGLYIHPSIGVKLVCCAGGSAPPQGDRKGPILSSSPLPPLQRNGTANSLYVVFVRAGVAWSGVGTLAVALGWGCGCLT